MDFLKDEDEEVMEFNFTNNAGEEFKLFFQYNFLSTTITNVISSILDCSINIKTIIESSKGWNYREECEWVRLCEYERFYDEVKKCAPKGVPLRIIVETANGYKYLSSTIDKNDAKRDAYVLVNLGEKKLGGTGKYRISAVLDAPGGGCHSHRDELTVTRYFSIYVGGNTLYKKYLSPFGFTKSYSKWQKV